MRSYLVAPPFLAVALALLLVNQAAGAEKVRDWQTGKVLNAERSRYFAGTVGSANTQTAVHRVYETFLIEGETHAYLAQERLQWRWSKAANLTVNGPVKYAAEKRKLFVIDEDGKVHEMEIVKKILRQSADQSNQPKE